MNLQKIFFTLLFTLSISPAYAYLDPGTGSMVISVVLAIVATLAYMCKSWFYGLKNKIKKK